MEGALARYKERSVYNFSGRWDNGRYSERDVYKYGIYELTPADLPSLSQLPNRPLLRKGPLPDLL